MRAPALAFRYMSILQYRSHVAVVNFLFILITSKHFRIMPL